MKLNSKTVISALQILCAIAVIGAVYVWAPVCSKMLVLETGKEVAMKCAHAAKAFVTLSILIGVGGLVSLLKKDNVKAVQIMVLVAAVLLFVQTFGSALGIGICLNPEMPCNATALWARIGSGLSAVTSAAILFSGDKSRRIPD